MIRKGLRVNEVALRHHRHARKRAWKGKKNIKKERISKVNISENVSGKIKDAKKKEEKEG